MFVRRAVLPFALVAAMVASSFQVFALGVLAAEIIEDLDISRGGLGAIVAANTLVGALTSPVTGRLTDRIGPRASVVIVLVMSAIGMGLTAAASNWLMLLGAAVFLGVPQGWGNPATNLLIATRVPTGMQGGITGIKQSGVTFGVFLAGLTLPGLAEIRDWQGACWFYSGIFMACAIVAIALLPADSEAVRRDANRATAANGTRLEPFVWRIVAFAFLMGASSGAIGRFLALFANEEVGMSVTSAGFVVALTGLLGMGTRVWAARLAESRVEPLRLLIWLAWSAVACSLLLVTATSFGAGVMWPVAVLYATGYTAWNAVAMLALITGVRNEHVGRAAGVFMFGFLGGHTVASPLAGAVVDAVGSYQPVWWATVVLSFAGSLVLIGPSRDRARADAPAQG